MAKQGQVEVAGCVRSYGWIRDIPDHRDHLYAAPVECLSVLPASADLRPLMPPVYDQGALGSCTSQAIAAAVQFDRKKQKLTPDFIPSRLFIYYFERLLEGTVNSDSGAQIRDGIKVIASNGAPTENDWAYIVSKFKQKPPAKAIADGKLDVAVQYQSVAQNLTQLKGCLVSGYPIVIGISVYASFESSLVAKTGVVPMPAYTEQMLGGHAVLICGFDDASQRFIVRNSWGGNWGQKGTFTIPYQYILSPQLASDFWTIRLIKG